MSWMGGRGGLACIPGTVFDHGHELSQYTPSLSCDRWVLVVGEKFCPVEGVIY